MRTLRYLRLLSLFYYHAVANRAPWLRMSSHKPLRPTPECRTAIPARPPVIDGIVSAQEWNAALRTNLSQGALYTYNDAAFLYALIDVTGDTVQDDPAPRQASDHLPDVRRQPRQRHHPRCGRQLWLDAGIARALSPKVPRPEQLDGLRGAALAAGRGFGASFASHTTHRFWELAISLDEIAAAPGSLVRLGVRQVSPHPDFDVYNPAGFTGNFANLIEIRLVAGQAQLLVLADESFLNALAPLKAHKDYTAMPTYVQSWQQLDAAFYAQGRDQAERVKRGIASYEQYYGTRYVMLVGDTNRFPVRYTMTDRGEATAYNRAYYSADFYYADLYEPGGAFETWDSNGNGYFGEIHGETITGTLNIDQVDLNPDVAVGRVPASTVAQVTTYVNKVINYEFNVYKAAWATRALSVATTSWLTNACQTKQDVIVDSLSGYTNYRLYQSGNPCFATDPPSSANINAKLNVGVRFLNYVGHGGTWGLAIPGDAYDQSDLAGLTNGNTLPIAFAVACDTAQYATQPPYSPYTDIYGVHHIGTSAGEVFTNVPPQPSNLQMTDNPSCFAESFLLQGATGGVGYVGCVTGAQPFARDLDKAFFESLDYGASTLGDMWNWMVYQYYVTNPPPATVNPADWNKVAQFHQPWKFHLFGDPSLRINGVSRFQPADFAGTYAMNHDSWRGNLSLWATEGDYIEMIPNMGGTYTDTSAQSHLVRGYVRTWKYPIPATDGPDHKLRFYIDFYDTINTSDDQRFEGYLFSQDRSKMAGVTWYGSTPYGFYVQRGAGATATLTGGYSPDAAGITKADFLGDYVMNHDGWPGALQLWALPDNGTLTVANVGGSYTDWSGKTHGVYGHVRTAGHPVAGPDHKITFYIDLSDTPANTADDQQFEGYLFTHNKEAIAGLTWWHTTPFGFYALRTNWVYLPFIVKH